MKYIEKFMSRASKALFISLTLLLCYGCDNVIDDAAQVGDGQLKQRFSDGLDITGFSGQVGDIYSQLRPVVGLDNHHLTSWFADDMASGKTSGKFAAYDSLDPTRSTANHTEKIDQFINIQTSIFQISDIIEEAINTAEEDTDPVSIEIASIYLAELKVLRAYCLFWYSQQFGRGLVVPGFGESITKVTELQELYEIIEKDLLAAEQVLPNKHPDDVGAGNTELEGVGRPNKGAVQAFLARVYLNWAGWPLKDQSKYALCAEKAKEVIDNRDAYGYELMPVFEDIWRIENKRNAEAVWLIEYFGDIDGQENRKYGIRGRLNTDATGGWDEHLGEVRFWEDFPEGPRKDGTYRNDLNTLWMAHPTNKLPVYAKITGPDGDLDSVTEGFRTGRSDFFIRYADVLLMFAEASGRAGIETPQAWSSLNDVRARAYPVGTPAVGPADGNLADLAFEERKWEFAAEYMRWHDLVRMELVEMALRDKAPRNTRVNGELLTEQNPIDPSVDLNTDVYFEEIPNAVLSRLGL